MEITNKVRIEICGAKYVISSTENPKYVKELATEIEEKVRTFMEKNPSAARADAYMIILLGYVDLYKKSEKNTDNIRSQLTQYLEDAARARIEADEYKREIEKLKREVNLLRQAVGKEPFAGETGKK